MGGAPPDLAAATKVWRGVATSPEAAYREGHALVGRSLTYLVRISFPDRVMRSM